MNGPERLFQYVRLPARMMTAPYSQRTHDPRPFSVLEDGRIFAALSGDILIIPELFSTPFLKTASQFVDQIGPRRRDISLFTRIAREVEEQAYSIPFGDQKLIT